MARTRTGGRAATGPLPPAPSRRLIGSPRPLYTGDPAGAAAVGAGSGNGSGNGAGGAPAAPSLQFPPQYPTSSTVYAWSSPVIPNSPINGTLPAGVDTGAIVERALAA